MSVLCLYHANCADGFAAALAVRLWLKKNNRLNGSEFIAMQYGDDPPNTRGRDVFIVDFSFPRKSLIKMFDRSESLTVIDHHKTAEAEIGDWEFAIFDMEKSGAMLTWEHLFPEEPPKLFKYIEDRDLWHWELPHSKEVSAGLRSHPADFDLWETFLDDIAIARLATDGDAILRYQNQQIESAMNRPIQMMWLGGYYVPVMNNSNLISEIGNQLAEGFPFAAQYFDTTDGVRVFSLRSVPGGEDVSEVAKRYGGGGHKHAAGFSVLPPDLRAGPALKRIKVLWGRLKQ